MSARPCAYEGCGRSKNAPIHLRQSEGFHAYLSDKPVGLQPMSAGMREYRASDAHKESYSQAESYCVGHALDAPGRCIPPLTPHHTLKRSVGGQPFAEAHAPVVTLCAWLNGAIESDPAVRAWALTTTFERNGVSYPFLVLEKDIAS